MCLAPRQLGEEQQYSYEGSGTECLHYGGSAANKSSPVLGVFPFRQRVSYMLTAESEELVNGDPDIKSTVCKGKVINGDEFALTVETKHGEITATTAIHRQRFSRRIGGVRFVEDGAIEELGHLSAAMTEKNIAAMLPADGQKTLVVCPAGVPLSHSDRATIVRDHVSEVVKVDKGAIFGPDMNCPEEVLDRVVGLRPELLGHLTGLSAALHGLAIDKTGHTAIGLDRSLTYLSERHPELHLQTATIQGLGAVGAQVARLLNGRGITIVAASTAAGAIVDAAGLDISALLAMGRQFNDKAPEVYGHCNKSATFHPDPNALLSIRADVFVPAARTMVMALGDERKAIKNENPQVVDAAAFLDACHVRVILEGANSPLTVNAESYLQSRGVVVCPDVLVNCGGVIGCFCEWAARGWHPTLDLAGIGELAEQYIGFAVENNMRRLLDFGNSHPRDAVRSIVSANREKLLWDGHREVWERDPWEYLEATVASAGSQQHSS